MEKSSIAIILSLLVPGLGQVYVGRTGRGAAAFIGSAILTIISFGILAIPCWLIAAWDANRTAKGAEIKIGGL